MKNSIKNALTVIIVLTIITVIYFFIIYFLKIYFIEGVPENSSYRNNEFGDFIGGVLNPLFTLISTISIIFLTYIIAKGEDIKAEKSIETQKRLTLNQMRQNALDNLIQKTNLYVYEIKNLSIHSIKNKFHQNVLRSMIEKDDDKQEEVIVWLIILNELENFTQLKYLFSDLFKCKEFIQKHNAIIDVMSKLCEEQIDMKFVKRETIENYIVIQQEFLTLIGDYIFSEF